VSIRKLNDYKSQITTIKIQTTFLLSDSEKTSTHKSQIIKQFQILKFQIWNLFEIRSSNFEIFSVLLITSKISIFIEIQLLNIGN
jgi:hypothetical protein